MYEEAYELCRNIERVMELLSKELRELDRNTVQYMIDEMQETIDQQKLELEQKELALENSRNVLEENKRKYQEALQRIAELEKNK